jgi:hypothetical protein
MQVLDPVLDIPKTSVSVERDAAPHLLRQSHLVPSKAQSCYSLVLNGASQVLANIWMRVLHEKLAHLNLIQNVVAELVGR